MFFSRHKKSLHSAGGAEVKASNLTILWVGLGSLIIMAKLP